jgi:spore germination cell wall hydrolase CwlJ-like protein
VCSVIKQGGYKQRHRCQFSWWCDGRSDRPVNRAAWKESQHLIKQGIANDPTNGALCYHAINVRLAWTK